MTAETITAICAVATAAAGFGAIVYRLGAIHADLRGLVRVVADHEKRLRSVERRV